MKDSSSRTGHAGQRDIFKKASKYICTSTVVVFPNSLSPADTEEDPDNPKRADEGDTQMKYSSD